MRVLIWVVAEVVLGAGDLVVAREDGA